MDTLHDVAEEPAGIDFRCAGAQELERQMARTRGELLRLWRAYRAALPPDMELRHAPELNPPRWELGHVGWFEEWWIARNPQRLCGPRANPEVARAAPLLRRADGLYDSSRVAHTRRWHLDLPDADATLRQVEVIRGRTLELLRRCGDRDDELYMFRLALAHEAMHLEAWIYMAQTLAIDLREAGVRLHPAPQAASTGLRVEARSFRCGHDGHGFAFDNELQAHEVSLDAFSIDASAVTWERYLPFVEDGGYDDPRWWSREGWAWRQRQAAARPRHLHREDGAWRRALFGRWVPVDPAEPAMHLTAHEAEAWCRWAGRRLPTEAEWECAAVTLGADFRWGEVWEWTATPFAPYAGFTPHPYRDYSQPWFDGRPVLKGASFATRATMRSPRYRNYFTAERNDLFAGFRSCSA